MYTLLNSRRTTGACGPQLRSLLGHRPGVEGPAAEQLAKKGYIPVSQLDDAPRAFMAVECLLRSDGIRRYGPPVGVPPLVQAAQPTLTGPRNPSYAAAPGVGRGRWSATVVPERPVCSVWTPSLPGELKPNPGTTEAVHLSTHSSIVFTNYTAMLVPARRMDFHELNVPLKGTEEMLPRTGLPVLRFHDPAQPLHSLAYDVYGPGPLQRLSFSLCWRRASRRLSSSTTCQNHDELTLVHCSDGAEGRQLT